MKWVLATSNEGKRKEFQTLLGIHGVELVSLIDIGFNDPIPETGNTFEENSRQKVDAVVDHTEYPVLADDSGLAVDSLEGAPGIYSARYAGQNATDAANRQLLLKNLSGYSSHLERRAGFVCVLSLSRPGHPVLTVRGECHGHVSHTEKGLDGFGYDSLFIPDGHNKTFAEMGMEGKEKISHRQQAVNRLVEALF